MLCLLNGCSCGEEGVHVARRGTTSDGRSVLLWSDGQITWGMGAAIRGIGAARESWTRHADLVAGHALLGEVCLLDAAEVVPVFRALRRLCRQPADGASWRWPPHRDGPSPGEVRRIIHQTVGSP